MVLESEVADDWMQNMASEMNLSETAFVLKKEDLFEEEVRICQPKFQRLETFGLGHLIITAASSDSIIDFVVRCFVPETGINEDPVTGSAHCVLAPLWSGFLNKTDMTSHQISKRGGKLLVACKNNSVEIKGKATTIFEGILKV
ncbi:UNVERIFIED_CONTAM: hypothetical protein GTU68_063635 [Idotea baltica]|nr:hypothetical protein [Idotea baltica]